MEKPARSVHGDGHQDRSGVHPQSAKFAQRGGFRAVATVDLRLAGQGFIGDVMAKQQVGVKGAVVERREGQSRSCALERCDALPM